MALTAPVVASYPGPEGRSIGDAHRWALLVLCCLLLSSSVSFAKPVPARDYRNGILDAELVVIVSQESPSSFRVEETFLGSANKGDSIELRIQIVQLPAVRP